MKQQQCILMVDDNATDRDAFCAAVREIDPDIFCKTLEDGAAALEYLRNKNNPTPDFIFLDLRMPRINGRRCLEMIRKEQRLQQVPVIIYTVAEDEDQEELIALGATHFAAKPTDPKEIYYIVSMILNAQW